MNESHPELAQRVFILLASASPRRAMLLKQAGFQFEVIPSQAEELQAKTHDIEWVVQENARLKGREVLSMEHSVKAPAERQRVLLSADTLVCTRERVYGKPAHLQEARQFLQELGGRAHRVLTGVFLHHCGSGRELTFVEQTTVRLKTFSSHEIEALFRKVNPLDKAAGYGFQDAPEIVTDLNGSRTNVFGLPMTRLFAELDALIRS